MAKCCVMLRARFQIKDFQFASTLIRRGKRERAENKEAGKQAHPE